MSGPRAGALPILPVPLREVTAIGVYDADGMIHALDVDDFHDRHGVGAGDARFRARRACRRRAGSHAGIEIDIEVGYGDDGRRRARAVAPGDPLLVAHWYENRAHHRGERGGGIAAGFGRRR